MTPAEHEQKVRALFREEALEHFETIHQALYAADVEPSLARERLQSALRAAHSLKGAARLSGFPELENMVHSWESCTAAVLEGKLELDGESIDLLARALEAAQQELEYQYFGSPRKLDVNRLFDQLNGHFGQHVELTRPQIEPATAGAVVEEGAKASTIRVDTSKLDRQMAGIEELLRLKVATELRLNELGQLVAGLGRWQSALAEARQLVRQKRTGRSGLGDQELSRVTTLLDEQWKVADQVVTQAGSVHAESRRTSDALAATTETLRDDVRAVRMLPVHHVLNPFVRMVRDLGRGMGKQVLLKVVGGDTEVDRDVLESIKDPVMHALRNAVDHGIESAAERELRGKPAASELVLAARSRAGTLELEISDDGRGIERAAVERAAVRRGIASAEQLSRMDDGQVRSLIFHDGFSTSEEVNEVSGRGVGMAVARSIVEKLGGRIGLVSEAGRGTSLTLVLPLTLATSRLLLVRVGKELFALPSATVERVVRVGLSELTQVDHGYAYEVDGKPLPVFNLADVLHVEQSEQIAERSFGVVIGGTTGRGICLVERVLDEQELVARGLGDQLRSVPNVSGVAVLADGRVVPILNAADLLKSAHVLAQAPLKNGGSDATANVRRVLVVDDSVTTRTLEKSILEAAGYSVETAVDGLQALDRLARASFDLVLSDVQMPRLDGLALARAIKQDQRLKQLPVILVSSLDTAEQRKQGLEAGADAYISKQEFEQGLLLATLERYL